eukprot:CAMPEP_0173183136 /NCGR_PEP_ID=MMETSP1141-20130122/8228_1 /TAXON_ID=483371 /ORGANISM="non described non described, Strain CCMP2298" /LENGTH=113 /DNA_ID=CAMNT_0014106313 /DNA_START=246 /DNA_END=587 /DNA_ORIENTATION=+
MTSLLSSNALTRAAVVGSGGLEAPLSQQLECRKGQLPIPQVGGNSWVRCSSPARRPTLNDTLCQLSSTRSTGLSPANSAADSRGAHSWAVGSCDESVMSLSTASALAPSPALQ